MLFQSYQKKKPKLPHIDSKWSPNGQNDIQTRIVVGGSDYVAPFFTDFSRHFLAIFSKKIFFPFPHHNFINFLIILTSKFMKNHLELTKKTSGNTLGAPLGMKIVILANSQYVSSENHVFQEPQEPEFDENLLEISFFCKADAPNQKVIKVIKKRCQMTSN